MQSASQPSASSTSSIRDRVGLVVTGATARVAVENIIAAEEAGVRQIWMTQPGAGPDTLTIFGAASTRTSSIRMGTAIVPTYPRHPLALAGQALTIEDLAPGRLRLGVGPSHRAVIENVYGLPMPAPLAHLREYVGVLRAALDSGVVDAHGTYYTAKTTFPRPPHTPILISALRAGAFQLAGEISDGALSWMCPVHYLLQTAQPAMRAGAEQASRSVPPLVAHLPVVLSTDRAAALAAARPIVSRYGQMPFYAAMFADAGFPVENGVVSDALVENLAVIGDEASVAGKLRGLLAQGLDELLVMPVPVADAAEAQARMRTLIGKL